MGGVLAANPISSFHFYNLQDSFFGWGAGVFMRGLRARSYKILLAGAVRLFIKARWLF